MAAAPNSLLKKDTSQIEKRMNVELYFTYCNVFVSKCSRIVGSTLPELDNIHG